MELYFRRQEKMFAITFENWFFWPVNNLIWDKLQGLKFASVESYIPSACWIAHFAPVQWQSFSSNQRWSHYNAQWAFKAIFRWLTNIFSCSELSNVHPGKYLVLNPCSPRTIHYKTTKTACNVNIGIVSAVAFLILTWNTTANYVCQKMNEWSAEAFVSNHVQMWRG